MTHATLRLSIFIDKAIIPLPIEKIAGNNIIIVGKSTNALNSLAGRHRYISRTRRIYVKIRLHCSWFLQYKTIYNQKIC